jgi:hypothetical protein
LTSSPRSQRERGPAAIAWAPANQRIAMVDTRPRRFRRHREEGISQVETRLEGLRRPSAPKHSWVELHRDSCCLFGRGESRRDEEIAWFRGFGVEETQADLGAASCR